MQVAQELFKNLLESGDDQGEPLSEPAAAKFFGVVSNGLEPKYACLWCMP
jgi:hypothetical protein